MAMIKEMPGIERPREKALRFGVDALSTRELLAILLRTGAKGESVLEVVDRLLVRSKGAAGLEKMSRKELCEIRGISDVKAVELLACIELNKRTLREKALTEDVIAQPEHLIQWLQKEIGPCPQEKFLAVYLDNCHHILSCQTMFVGTVNMSHVYPRDVLRVERQRAFEIALRIARHHVQRHQFGVHQRGQFDRAGHRFFGERGAVGGDKNALVHGGKLQAVLTFAA